MSVAPPPHGELVFVSDSNRSTLSRLASAGRALRLASGVYAVGATLPPVAVARHHLYALVAAFWPGGVICGKSALAGGPSGGWVFVAQPEPQRASPLKLPGYAIAPVVGPEPLPGDMQVPHGLYMSGITRQLVENIDLPGRPPKYRAGTEAAEDRIDELARSGGAGRIEKMLQELDVIAGSFDPRAVEAVRARLAAVLGTFTGDVTSERLRARIAGVPYDAHRLEMLRNLVDELDSVVPTPRPAEDGARFEWLPFYEAYFSNFIEGTEFGVDEARAIAVEGHESTDRPADAHDVTATFRLASDATDREQVPRSGAELLVILRDRHAVLMAARPEKRPGEFKLKQNYAAGYQFVEPELVVGTLGAGYDVLSAVLDPLARAVGMMVLITEAHPFDDGNGRVARLVANAELSRAGQCRIVIPTVFRNNYLAGLTAVSNGKLGASRTLMSILDFAQKWAAAIDWRTYEGAQAQIEACNGFVDPGAAEAQGRRLQLPEMPHQR